MSARAPEAALTVQEALRRHCGHLKRERGRGLFEVHYNASGRRAQGAVVKTALGTPIAAGEYTLPRVWARLRARCEFERRRAEVESFNRQHAWCKRGISMTHCR